MRIKGVDAQMKTFGFLFGVMLGQSILWHMDNLSKGPQHEDLSASEGQTVTQLTLETLSKLRSDESFDGFYEDVKAKAEAVGVNEPLIPPRKGKMPNSFRWVMQNISFCKLNVTCTGRTIFKQWT